MVQSFVCLSVAMMTSQGMGMEYSLFSVALDPRRDTHSDDDQGHAEHRGH